MANWNSWEEVFHDDVISAANLEDSQLVMNEKSKVSSLTQTNLTCK